MTSIRKIYHSSAGFTLIEFLVAISITTIVIGITGFGLVAIMQNNRKAEAETVRRTELNRALDFISEEVKLAKKVELNAETAAGYTFTPEGSNVQKILALEIPTTGGTSKKVVYYIATPPANSVWSGTKVIYRWGPEFNSAGQYSTASNINKLLVDFIDSSTPNPNSNCSTNWSANPTVDDRKGFYACVAPNYRSAELHLRGQLTDAYGNSRDPIEVTTKVFSRPFVITNFGGGSHFSVIFGAGGGGGGGGDGADKAAADKAAKDAADKADKAAADKAAKDAADKAAADKAAKDAAEKKAAEEKAAVEKAAAEKAAAEKAAAEKAAAEKKAAEEKAAAEKKAAEEKAAAEKKAAEEKAAAEKKAAEEKAAAEKAAASTLSGVNLNVPSIKGTFSTTETGNRQTSTVSISWNNVTDATAYEIFVCGPIQQNRNCTPNTSLGTASSGISKDITSVDSNNKICYAVKAKNSTVSSVLSNILCFNHHGIQ